MLSGILEIFVLSQRNVLLFATTPPSALFPLVLILILLWPSYNQWKLQAKLCNISLLWSPTAFPVLLMYLILTEVNAVTEIVWIGQGTRVSKSCWLCRVSIDRRPKIFHETPSAAIGWCRRQKKSEITKMVIFVNGTKPHYDLLLSAAGPTIAVRNSLCR